MKDKEKYFIDIENVALLIRALKHPFRLRILNLIIEKGPISVNEILENLNSEASITSQNLKILRDSNLLVLNKKGKFIFYEANIPLLHNFAIHLKDFDEKTLEFKKSLRKPLKNV